MSHSPEFIRVRPGAFSEVVRDNTGAIAEIRQIFPEVQANEVMVGIFATRLFEASGQQIGSLDARVAWPFGGVYLDEVINPHMPALPSVSESSQTIKVSQGVGVLIGTFVSITNYASESDAAVDISPSCTLPALSPMPVERVLP